jgi:hypothetical protein
MLCCRLEVVDGGRSWWMATAAAARRLLLFPLPPAIAKFISPTFELVFLRWQMEKRMNMSVQGGGVAPVRE